MNAARDQRAAPAHRGPHAASPRRGRPGARNTTSTGRRRCSTRPACCASSSSGTTSCAIPSRSRRWSTARSPIATSEPQGPVYVTLPREVLAQGSSQKFSQDTTIPAASAPAADPDALEEAAKLLGAAETAAAHHRERRAHARELARDRAARADARGAGDPLRPRYLALSTEHPMQCGWDPQPLLKEADVVLVVDCDVPWIPKRRQSEAEAKIIHIGPDPLFARYPLRGFRTDLALTGGVAPTLQALWRSAQKQRSRRRTIEERARSVSEHSQRSQEQRARRLRSRAVDHHRQVALGLHEPAARQRHAPRERVPDGARGNADPEPGRYFGNPRRAASAGAWARRSARSSPRRTRP